ncbi:MAG: DNA-directed RNA polymerase subunit beta [Desulfobulbus sp.]|jgi:DNA-directed RNA polymerase subunit beta
MRRVRKSFAKTSQIIEPPHLIAMQRESYEHFLQWNVPPDQRTNQGLQGIFQSVFPITDFNGMCLLEFVRYSFGDPKYTIAECIERGMTYEAPLKVTVRLITFDVDEESGVQSVRDIKEQEVFLGALPLMTQDGVFVINGTERVIVNQLQRSPGLFYTHDNGKSHASGKRLYSARIIPVRGSWLDFEFDIKDILYVRIDRRRKLPVTVLLKAFGYNNEQLLNEFYPADTIHYDGGEYFIDFNPDTFLNQRVTADIISPVDGSILSKKGKKVTKALIKRIESSGITSLPITKDELLERFFARDVINEHTEEVVFKCNDVVTEEALEIISELNINTFSLLHIDGVNFSDSFRKTLLVDKVKDSEEALIEIYRRLRPSSPPTPEIAKTFFENLFFSAASYDLSEVGRYKINTKLGLDTPIEERTLTREDIIKSVKYLVRLKDESKDGDDIDHLGNRRVRTVGELCENQFRMGLIRMERAIKERMTLQEIETLMPHDLVNPKPVTSAIKEFFGTSQLSQFMDQTNPLSEVTHKRRLSALGPGGLSRERAGFEVRDVHPTHYGRICPIETPEGPNIGLIVSLATYAKVNPYGFIETPYRYVHDRVVSDEYVYLSASQEEKQVIAPAKSLRAGERLEEEYLIARQEGEVTMVPADEVTMMDVAPNQMVSIAASLIPFLENNDANRALMGSNMQRQAVPLLRTSSPLVGTGVEKYVARDSGACLLAAGDGVIEEADANRIVIRYDQPGTDGFEAGIGIYRLAKYKKSNQNTCFNQKALMFPGQRVTKGAVLADGPSTEAGELGLGKNVTIAFMPWRGYNFEDSILVNERLLKEDTFTSIHIEIFETMARDTKLGKEEITRDIPNIGEEGLRNLDDSGIIRIGAEVHQGDMLVGKVTPKGETMLSPEEKLLRAIFGEKASDVKDSSLRVPPGVEGVVIDAKVFSRKGVDKDERTLMIEEMEIDRLNRDMEDELKSLKGGVRSALTSLLAGRTAKNDVKDKKGKVILKLGKQLTAKVIDQIDFAELRELDFAERAKYEEEIEAIFQRYNNQAALVRNRYQGIVERMEKGDDLPPGVVKMVKIYVATKRKLAVGDKMAGRHGNKGVVSRLLPEEDMPFFADGTTVDLVLNPLGVPSRMNVGQVLECHLGYAAKKLGEKIAQLAQKREIEAVKKNLQKFYSQEEYQRFTEGLSDDELLDVVRKYAHGFHVSSPVFDGASESEISQLLVDAGGVDQLGQTVLYDGLTGEPFDNQVTVGCMYMLKLHHLVDNKIHARSTGPYSLVTQQPLGGKAQFGGQRLGEMEVWAMEAYGAAYTLKEFLTVKSDDVEGRTTMYEKIVKGDNFLETGMPESFHVLVKELKGLCLDIELME